MPQFIPSRPSLDFLKDKAKRLHKDIKLGDGLAWSRLRKQISSPEKLPPAKITLAQCQFVIAREYGFDSWPKLKHAITNAPDLDFWVALEKGDLMTVRHAWLANPQILETTKNGHGILEYAAMYGYSERTSRNREIIEFLLEHGVPLTAGDAAYLDMPDRLAEVIAADPECVDRKVAGWTPLQRAAERGSFACAGILVEHGANVNTQNAHGESPLALASHAGPMKSQAAQDVIELLLERGAEVDVFLASMLGRVDLLESLLNAEPSRLEAEDSRGERPIHHAAHNLRLDAIRFLLQRSADVEGGDRAKKTPFIWAAIHAWDKGGPEILDLLLAHGAKIQRPDKDGMTALDYAIEYRFNGVRDLLLARGATAIRHADKIKP